MHICFCFCSATSEGFAAGGRGEESGGKGEVCSGEHWESQQRLTKSKEEEEEDDEEEGKEEGVVVAGFWWFWRNTEWDEFCSGDSKELYDRTRSSWGVAVFLEVATFPSDS